MNRLDPTGDWTDIQRLVLPSRDEREILPLYMRGEGWSVDTRRRVLLAGGATLSTATYFGVFPAGYWRRHTSVATVRFRADVRGSVDVFVRGAHEDGSLTTVARHTAVDESLRIDVSLETGTLQLLWVEIQAAASASVENVSWQARATPPSTCAICITTFNRGEDCVGVLERIAGEAGLDSRVREVIVVDQGSRALQDTPGFDAVARDLDGRLRVIVQPNLGGAGGFSRGMLTADASVDHILLLDDDVRLEPESILRLLDFADRCATPTIVGAHMLSLTQPRILHSYGERIERSGFWWVPVAPDLVEIDLATHHLEDDPALRRTYDVDFNGWWMCLLPAEDVRRTGAALPLFIKWDDAEFGLRAAARGVPTVTLPGAALWHMPWTAKDDGLDWQAYYQLRNRLVTALIHSPHRHGGRLLLTSLAQDLNHILCLQYGSAVLRRRALRDVLSGPEHLAATQAGTPAELSRLLTGAGQKLVDESAAPRPRGATVAHPPRGAAVPVRLARVLWHQLRPVSSGHSREVDIAVPRAGGKWWSLGVVDSATVESATGDGVFVGRRVRRTALSLARDAIVLRMRLLMHWPAVARAYREAAPRLASAEAWNARFDSAAPPVVE